jgi:hypothetical protein
LLTLFENLVSKKLLSLELQKKLILTETYFWSLFSLVGTGYDNIFGDFDFLMKSDEELNRSREDCVVISGLDHPTLGQLSHQDTKNYFRGVFSKLIGLECPEMSSEAWVEVFVSFRRDQVTPMVEAKFKTIANASSFRKSSAVLAKAKDANFEALFFANSVTQATRVRIEILRAIAKKLTTDSESAYVHGFLSRPIMHYIVKENMPSDCAGTGRGYTFVDAVSRFGDLLMPIDLAPAYK